MASIPWKSIDALEPERFARARHQVHSAVLWLARMAGSYGDDPHPSLLWNADRRAISTRPLDRELGMELRLPELILQFTEHGVPVRHEFELEGHTQAHVEAWILVELLHRDVDRGRFSKVLPYDVSNLMTGDVVEFSPEAFPAELEALAGWYENALAIMAEQPGEALLWPEDMALEHIQGAVRAGFSPALALSGDPGFYVTRQADARGLPPQSTLSIEALRAGQDGASAVAGFFDHAMETMQKS